MGGHAPAKAPSASSGGGSENPIGSAAKGFMGYIASVISLILFRK